MAPRVTFYLYDMATKDRRGELLAPEGLSLAGYSGLAYLGPGAAVSPDGRHLAVAGFDGARVVESLWVADVKTGNGPS